MDLSFTISAGPRQRSHFQVRVPRDLWPHFTVSDSKLHQPGRPGPPIYIPQQQVGPVISPDTGFPFRPLRRLAGLRWTYSTQPPHGIMWVTAIPPLSLSLLLRPTVSRPVYLGMKHSSGAYNQIFVTVRRLQVSRYGALFLTRGRICRLQLLRVLVSAFIFGSESVGTCDHILLSQIRDFTFRRLLRLVGLRWRYSTPLPPLILIVTF
jgi:hypothetical protein